MHLFLEIPVYTYNSWLVGCLAGV